MLHPQLLYQGKTIRCLPSIDFPANWDVFYSPNHWSNSSTMVRFVEEIIVAYATAARNTKYGNDAKALCLFAAYAPHKTKEVLSVLSKNNIEQCFIPASWTSELQPLYLSVNDPYKKCLRIKFEECYSTSVEDKMNKGVDVVNANVHFNPTRMKPIHAKWPIECHSSISKATVMNGFTKAGILRPSQTPQPTATAITVDDSDVSTMDSDASTLILSDQD